MSTRTASTVINNGTTDETARIYAAFKKIKNGKKGSRGVGRKAATEQLARTFGKSIAEIREAVLREQATAEGVSFEDKLASFEKSREFSVVNHQMQELGGTTCFTDENTNTIMAVSFADWMHTLQLRWDRNEDPEEDMTHPLTGEKIQTDRYGAGWHYLWFSIYKNALREALTDATTRAMHNRTKLSNELVQEAINDHPMSKDYGKPLLDVKGLRLNLNTPFWSWFNTMTWVR